MPGPNPFAFSKSFSAGGTAAGIEITANTDHAVWQAVADNQPLPAGDITLAKGSLKASGGVDFTAGTDGVHFKGGASTYAALGFYGSEQGVLRQLKVEGQDDVDLRLVPAGGDRFGVLSWGYQLDVSARGKIALAGEPGSIALAADASRERLLAVIRRVDATDGGWDAIQHVVEALRLPGQIRALNDLLPGTWLFAEVDGSIAVELSGTFGYDFDWVRSVHRGDIDGDVGLKIALGVNVALGVKSSGRYVIVVSRSDGSSPVVGVRVHKRRYRGWDFALNAGVAVQASIPPVPDTFDGFLAAFLGVQGTQVVRDLQTLKGWVDTADVPARLSGIASAYLAQRIKNLVGAQGIGTFESMRDRVLAALDAWDALPERATSVIWSYLDAKLPLKAMTDFLTSVKNANAETFRDLVARQLGTGAIWKEQLMNALAEGGVFDALANSGALKTLQSKAEQVLSVLDSASDGLAILQNLHDWIGNRLSIEAIRNVANDADVANLDPWLKAKIEALLGRPAVLAEITKLQTTIRRFESRWNDMYDAARQALTKRYEFEVAATYSRSATHDALVDLEFDLSQATALPPFLDALQGRFGKTIAAPPAGVTVRGGTITHRIDRHAHVGISLPWSKVDLDHVNAALAAASTKIAADGERILVYDVQATDDVSARVRGRLERESRLALALSIPANARRAGVASGRLTYSFRSAQVAMSPFELRERVVPIIDGYFKGLFDGGGVEREPFTSWITDLDARRPHLGSNLIGNVFLAFDLALPERAVTAWLKAPPDPNDQRYFGMSTTIQSMLRAYIPMVYFADLTHYKEASQSTVAALLGYASTWPVALAAEDWYWNFADPQKVTQLVMDAGTIATLGGKLDHIRDLLQGAGQTSLAGWYGRGRTNQFLGAALSDTGRALLRSLFSSEVRLIRAAFQAAQAIARFRHDAQSDADEAVVALSSFASELTEAFNEKTVSIYTKNALRPLGPLIAAEAGRAFDSAAMSGSDAASLTVAVIRDGVAFPPPSLADYIPEPGTVVTQDRLISAP